MGATEVAGLRPLGAEHLLSGRDAGAQGLVLLVHRLRRGRLHNEGVVQGVAAESGAVTGLVEQRVRGGPPTAPEGPGAGAEATSSRLSRDCSATAR